MYGLDIRLNDKEYVESIKYYSGNYWQQVEDTSIDEYFLNNRFVAFAVNPTDIFSVWETDKKFNDSIFIRLFDVTNVDNFYEDKYNWYKDIFVGSFYGRYRITNLLPSANFVLQLGYFKDKEFKKLLQSNFVRMPNNFISTNYHIRMATKVFKEFEAKKIVLETIKAFSAELSLPTGTSMGVLK